MNNYTAENYIHKPLIISVRDDGSIPYSYNFIKRCFNMGKLVYIRHIDVESSFIANVTSIYADALGPEYDIVATYTDISNNTYSLVFLADDPDSDLVLSV